MHSVVVCPPPLRLPRCLAAPSPPVSLSRLLVTSPPRLLGSSTLASSFTGCVALLLSALLPALLATLLFALTLPLSAPAARRRRLPTTCCACKQALSLLLPFAWRELPDRLSLSDLWASALGFSANSLLLLLSFFPPKDYCLGESMS